MSFPKFSKTGGLLSLDALVQADVMTHSVSANQHLTLGNVKNISPQNVVHSFTNFGRFCGATHPLPCRHPACQVFQKNARERQYKNYGIDKKEKKKNDKN